MNKSERFLAFMLVAGPSPHPTPFRKESTADSMFEWEAWIGRAERVWGELYGDDTSFPVNDFEAWQIRNTIFLRKKRAQYESD